MEIFVDEFLAAIKVNAEKAGVFKNALRSGRRNPPGIALINRTAPGTSASSPQTAGSANP